VSIRWYLLSIIGIIGLLIISLTGILLFNPIHLEGESTTSEVSQTGISEVKHSQCLSTENQSCIIASSEGIHNTERLMDEHIIQLEELDSAEVSAVTVTNGEVTQREDVTWDDSIAHIKINENETYIETESQAHVKNKPISEDEEVWRDRIESEALTATEQEERGEKWNQTEDTRTEDTETNEDHIDDQHRLDADGTNGALNNVTGNNLTDAQINASLSGYDDETGGNGNVTEGYSTETLENNTIMESSMHEAISEMDYEVKTAVRSDGETQIRYVSNQTTISNESTVYRQSEIVLSEEGLIKSFVMYEKQFSPKMEVTVTSYNVERNQGTILEPLWVNDS